MPGKPESSSDDDSEDDVPATPPKSKPAAAAAKPAAAAAATPPTKIDAAAKAAKEKADQAAATLAAATAKVELRKIEVEAGKLKASNLAAEKKIKAEADKKAALDKKEKEKEEKEAKAKQKAEAAKLAKQKAEAASKLSKEEQAAAKMEAARVLKEALDKDRAERAEKAAHEVTGFDKVKYQAALFMMTTKLYFDTRTLKSSIENKKMTAGEPIFDALMVNDHERALKIFIDCKKAVHELEAELVDKEAEYQKLKDFGEGSSVQKPITPAEKAKVKAEGKDAPKPAAAAGGPKSATPGSPKLVAPGAKKAP